MANEDEDKQPGFEAYVCQECGSRIPVIFPEDLKVMQYEEALPYDDSFLQDELKTVPMLTYNTAKKEMVFHLYAGEEFRKFLADLLKEIADSNEVSKMRVVLSEVDDDLGNVTEVKELWNGHGDEFVEIVTKGILTIFGGTKN